MHLPPPLSVPHSIELARDYPAPTRPFSPSCTSFNAFRPVVTSSLLQALFLLDTHTLAPFDDSVHANGHSERYIHHRAITTYWC